MFSHDQTAGRVVCLADYGRVKLGAIVPETNELYADVEAWITEGNELMPFDGYPEIPMSEEQLEDWRDSLELSRFQARHTLRHFGYFDQVEAYMVSEQVTDLERDAWADAQVFRYRSATMDKLAALLEISDEQRDEMFRYGLTVEA